MKVACRQVLIIPVIMVVFLVACTSSGEPSTEIRPIDEILDGAVEVTDVTGTSAVVRVTTSIDVVCSVVFGPDTGYGSLSTDLDMGGQAHSDHAAPMRGLEPDTVYHFRLQGTGPDGTLYVSEDMTFRTDADGSAAQAAEGNVATLAEGARISDVSSSFGSSDAWRAENAIDGDAATEWSSDGDGNDAFIEVELAEPSQIEAIGMWTRTMGNTGQITSFRVVTDDGTILGPFTLPDSDALHVFPVDVFAERLRFEAVESSGGNTGAVEIAAFASE